MIFQHDLSEEEWEEEKEVYSSVHERKLLKKSRFAEENVEKATTTNELTSLYEEHTKEEHELKMRIMQKKEIFLDLHESLLPRRNLSKYVNKFSVNLLSSVVTVWLFHVWFRVRTKFFFHFLVMHALQ